MSGGGRIDASTFVAGPGGSIDVTASGSIAVEGEGSGIASRSGGAGPGGDVRLAAPRIDVRAGGEVEARSEPGLGEVRDIFYGLIFEPEAAMGDAGSLTLVANELRLFGGSLGVSSANADGGTITVEAQELVHLDAGEITASVDGGSETTGGNVALGPEVVVLANGSRIEARANGGRGGRIEIRADSYFAFPGSVVSAEAGDPALSGTVEVHTPDVNLAGALKPDMKPWEKLVERVRKPKPSVKVALVGKYVELQDAYMSVREALKHAALHNDVEVQIGWVHSADLEKDKGWEVIQSSDAILVPGGFGSRGIDGKIMAARYAREKKVPYLGLCLGMQVMCIDFARGVLNHEDANSSEFDRSTEFPVIDLMIDQRSITDMGGTMRLGLYPCELKEGFKAAKAYGVERVDERHRHRFEFNNAFCLSTAGSGWQIGGASAGGWTATASGCFAARLRLEDIARPNSR